MGFKDLPGGSGDKSKKGSAEFSKELSPKSKDYSKSK